MRSKIFQIIVTALVTTAIILAAQSLFPGRPLSIDSPARAQQIVSGNLYVINQDSYVLTTSSNGSDVYVYYFDANPEIDRTSIKFVTSAKAR